MPRIAYVNGRYVAHADAAVHIEDRGYQFADGVYEVCEVARGFIVDMPRHLGRLSRSLSELSIAWPVSRGVMPLLMREVVRRNHVTTGLVLFTLAIALMFLLDMVLQFFARRRSPTVATA